MGTPIDVNLLNIKQAQAIRGIGAQHPVEFTPTVDYTGTNLFAGNYEGVNEKLGVGSHIAFAQQAGIDRTGRTLGFA